MRKDNYEERSNNGSAANSTKQGKGSSRKNRQNSQSRGGRSNQSGNSKERSDRPEESNSVNDPAIYNKYPVILNQAGKVNNYHPVGLNGADMFGEQNPETQVRTIPGIAAMNIIPAVPNSSSGFSTLQQSAYQTWTKVRDAISGSRKYDPVDLQLMSIGVSQAVACATWLKRFFNFAYTMSPYNRFAPERLFAAMHCNYDDFIRNLPQYRARYNRITINLSRIYANTDNNYHKMIRSLFKTVYAEPGDNGQLYLYNPGGFYEYTWKQDAKGVTVGALVFRSTDENNRNIPMGEAAIVTFDTLLNVYEKLVFALIGDEDVNTMSGDILKTYGEKAQVALPLALESDTDIPHVSAIDLAQFMMSYVPINNASYVDFQDIIQTDANFISYNPKLRLTADSIPQYNYDHAQNDEMKAYMLRAGANTYNLITQRNRILLNDYVDLNKPENVAEMVRNIPIFRDYSVSDFETFILSRTPEHNYIDLDVVSSVGVLPYSLVVYFMDSYRTVEDITLLTVNSVIRNFTFLPMRVFYQLDTDPKTEVMLTDVWLDANLNDYYAVSKNQVQQVQDAMALSMFSDL